MDQIKVILKIVVDSLFGPILLLDPVFTLVNQWPPASVCFSGRRGCITLDGNMREDRP